MTNTRQYYHLNLSLIYKLFQRIGFFNLEVEWAEKSLNAVQGLLKSARQTKPALISHSRFISEIERFLNRTNIATIVHKGEKLKKMKNLGKFISIAPYEEAQMICKNKIDTVLLSRKCNNGPQYEECWDYFR